MKGDTEHRKFAGRVRQVVAEFTDEGTVTALGREAAHRFPKLSSKVRNWIPPIERWQWSKDTEKWRPAAHLTKTARAADWNQLRFPQADSLFEFCELTLSLPSHLLLGEGPRYRGESRTETKFMQELTLRLRQDLGKKGVDLAMFDVGIAPRIAEVISECICKEIDTFQRAYKFAAIGFELDLPPNPRDHF
jgi:hypothetical protein